MSKLSAHADHELTMAEEAVDIQKAYTDGVCLSVGKSIEYAVKSYEVWCLTCGEVIELTEDEERTIEYLG